tara:strand:+ start:8765 stop:9154 length:390 start_codon:yes stop_codon:yes gene_type:complete
MHDQLARASVGRAGEYLALSRISRAGHECTLVNNNADDAYIKTTNNLLLTLQIKTAGFIPLNYKSYSFHTRNLSKQKRSDIWAFVALDIEKIFFCRGDDLSIKSGHTRLRPTMFLNEKTLMEEVFNSFF